MKKYLLLDIHGVRHAVAAPQVRTVREAGSVIRPPFSPVYMAGLTVIDGRTTVLADLGACLGWPPVSRQQASQVLLPSRDGNAPGFLVEGEVLRTPVPDDALRPLSTFLPLPFRQEFLLLEGRAVPLIDLKALLRKIEAGEWEPSPPEMRAVPDRKRQMSRIRNHRLLTIGAERYAFPSADLRPAVAATPPVHLPDLPPFVKGMVSAEGSILPVIGLEPLLGEPQGETGTLLRAGEAGGEFLLSARDDQGEIRGKALPLPPLVQSSGITHALPAAGSLLPLLATVSLIGETDDLPPLLERYSPALQRIALGQKPVPVLEFNLLGNRQAIPREQMEAVLPLPAFRPIPRCTPLVAGVTEHDGDLWPVIDLALYFGRTTRPGPHTRVIAVRDRDFRALVLADSILGERTVPVEAHRDLPFSIPHNLVFGCYLDGGSVVLALNVPALAVRFDPSLVRIFQGAVPPVEDVPSKAEERTPGVSPPLDMPEELLPPEPSKEEIVSPEGPRVEEALEPIEPEAAGEIPRCEAPETDETPTAAPISVPLPEDEPELPAADHPAAESHSRLEVEEPQQEIPLSSPVPEMEIPLPDALPEGEFPADSHTDGNFPPPIISLVEESEEQEKPAAGEITQGEETGGEDLSESMASEMEAIPSPIVSAEGKELPSALEETVPDGGEENPAVPREEGGGAGVTETACSPDGQENLQAEGTSGKWIGAIPEPAHGADGEQGPLRKETVEEDIHGAAAADPTEEDDFYIPPPPSPFSSRPVSRQSRTHAALAAVLALVLTGLLWLWFTPDDNQTARTDSSSIVAAQGSEPFRPTEPTPVARTSEPLPAPASSAQETPGEGMDPSGIEEAIPAETPPPPPPASPVPPPAPPQRTHEAPQAVATPETVHSVTPSAVESPLEPLVSDPAPASPPTWTTGLYEVRQGDTLWDIATRFTGDPFDYPRLARENAIRNPDRIYPGQQITILKPAEGPNINESR